MPNGKESTSNPSPAQRARSRSAIAGAIANGTAALVLAFLDDEFGTPLLAIAVGCVVAGAMAKGLSDHISQRYSGRRPLSVNLPERWEWVVTCVQVGLAVLIAWSFGAAVGAVVAAVVAGAALPDIEPARRSWQGLAKLVGGAD